MSDWTPWCTGYYKREFCKQKIAELKEEGAEAKIGGSVKENGIRYYRILLKVS